MTTLDRPPVHSDAAVIERLVERRIDGLGIYLTMLSNAVPSTTSPAGQTGREAILLDVVRVAAAAMPKACAISVVQLGSDKARTVVTTDRSGADGDALQFAAKQGPCLDAVAQQQTQTSADLFADHRWPVLSHHRSSGPGVRSVISVPLTDSGIPNAALNVYSDRVAAWSDLESRTGTTGAVLVGALMALAAVGRTLKIDNLQIALESNRIIGAAVGFVMARRMCTHGDAMAYLTQASQDTNVKLRTLADQILHTGVLPELPSPTEHGPRGRHDVVSRHRTIPSDAATILSAPRRGDDGASRLIAAAGHAASRDSNTQTRPTT